MASSARCLRTAAVVWRAPQAAAGLSTFLGREHPVPSLRALRVRATRDSNGHARRFRAAYLPHALVALAWGAQRWGAGRSHALDCDRKGLATNTAIRGSHEAWAFGAARAARRTAVPLVIVEDDIGHPAAKSHEADRSKKPVPHRIHSESLSMIPPPCETSIGPRRMLW
jgi:hypothetical protein